MTEVSLSINSILKSIQDNVSKLNTQKLLSLINELQLQLKQLDEHQTYQYYYLISELYATKLNNISRAYKCLQRFEHCYENQVILQIQMRYSVYRFLQGKYSEAIQHFNNVVHLIQEDNQLKDKTQFFFSKFINVEALQKLSNDPQNFNFQAKFILSIFYEFQESYAQGIQLFSSCLSQQLSDFQRYQATRRFLTFNELIKNKEKSSIKIPNKTIEDYKLFVQKSKDFSIQFEQKIQFLQNVLTLLLTKRPFTQNQFNQIKTYKFLAMIKIQKCIKLAKDKNIKLSLQQTLFNLKSLNQNSSQNQNFQRLINFDFVKAESKGFSCLRKIDASIKLIKWKFFDSLLKYTIESSPKKKNVKIKQSNYKMIQTKKTSSEILDQFDQEFTGSKMVKIHASSEGNQQRYFYIKPQQLIQKLRLYYTSDQKSKSSGDSYYSLKGLKKLSQGKKTEALKRKDAAKFDQDKCFALIFTGEDKQRNFYVPDKNDYVKWISLIRSKICQVGGISKMKGTIAYSKVGTLKKSKKVVQI